MDSTAIRAKTYSLQEVLLSIQSVLQKTYANKNYWVRCELSRISLHAQSGHCYLELIDKNETSIVAQMRGIIWADRYRIIYEKFQAVTNTPLAAGMKVMLHCSVSFHPLHGLSLTITDIEPSFTLGEMARMKNESIARLKKEGLFDKNKKLKIPMLPSRLAIISVDTSRGFMDFISTISNHQRKYSIGYKLFDAILQGDNAVPTIVNAINKINKHKNNFDAIVIIRGGAGDAGLACYDEFALASVIADSVLPVITGIGHASNETVSEMVSFRNCITPTAAATFFLEKFDQQFILLSQISALLAENTRSSLKYENQLLSTGAERFSFIIKNQLSKKNFQIRGLLAGLPANLSKYFSISKTTLEQAMQTVINIQRYGKHIAYLIELNRQASELKNQFEKFFIGQRKNISDHTLLLHQGTNKLKRENDLIIHIGEKINLLDPVNTLKRGYSITRINGKSITDANEIPAGIKLETQLANGFIISTTNEN